MARQVRYRLTVDWTRTGTWVNESDYLVSASGAMSYAPPHKSVIDGRGVVDTMTATLRNNTGRFSSMYSAGDLYNQLRAGGGYRIPIRFDVSIDGGTNYIRVFTGVAKIPTERAATPRTVRTVTLLCRSREELLLQARASTPLVNLLAHNAAVYTEAEYIIAWLTQMGFSSADWNIDPGIYVIPYAWLDDESPLEDVWLLAAAAGGRFYTDPDGVFCYENAAHYLHSDHTTTVDSLNANNYTELAIDWPDDKLFNQITVESAPREPGAALIVWTPEEPIVIPSGASTTVIARFRQPVITITDFTWRAKTASSRDISSDVTLATPSYYAQRVQFTWTNNHASQAYLYGVELSGVPLLGSRSQEITITSVDLPHGSTLADLRVKAIRSNPYLQSVAQARSLAAFVLSQTETPRATFTLAGVPGRPAYRLGQRIAVANSQLISSTAAMLLTRIEWQAGVNGFTQTLTGVDLANDLYEHTTYFRIGSSALNSTHPVFY